MHSKFIVGALLVFFATSMFSSQSAFAGGVCFFDSDCNDNDGNQCTGPNQCIVFVCVQPPLSGNSCNDGNQCTGNDVCVVGSCIGSSLDRDGRNCGSGPSICSDQDTCFGGSCFSNHKPLFTSCDRGTCFDEGLCGTIGDCIGSDPMVGAPCGDQTNTACNLADTCGVTGSCRNNVQPNSTPCGDSSSTECTNPDSCSSGVCQPNDIPADTACEADGDVCTGPDTCDGTGTCNVGPEITETQACFAIGGQIIPIESTSLILAGANSFSWMIPVVLSVLGIGLFVVSRKSE